MKHEGASAHCWPIEDDEELSFVPHEQGVFKQKLLGCRSEQDLDAAKPLVRLFDAQATASKNSFSRSKSSSRPSRGRREAFGLDPDQAVWSDWIRK